MHGENLKLLDSSVQRSGTSRARARVCVCVCIYIYVYIS